MARRIPLLRFYQSPVGLILVALALAFPTQGQILLSDYSASQPLKVMAIGDSITDDCSYNGAWRQFLQPLLTTNGYPFMFVGRQSSSPTRTFTETRHEGYCGAVIAAPGMVDFSVHGYAGKDVYLLKILAETLTNITPDLALVVMGANDIGRGRDPYWVATNDIPRLLDLLFSKAPTANVILTKTTTLQNATLGYATNSANVMLYNAALQALVQERAAAGQKVFLADMFSAVDYGTMFNSDHLHPNLTGLNAMAQEFLTRIQLITVRSNPVTVTSALIPAGAVWKYSDTGDDLGQGWTRPDFDDRTWSSGPARLGYGDSVVATRLSSGLEATNHHMTTYFRRSFVVPDNLQFTNLNVRLARMHGAVVWLNGQELFRTNMLTGSITFTNRAWRRVVGETGYILYPTNLAVPPLPPGTNVVAVEVHLFSPSDPLCGFDLEMLATGSVLTRPSITVARAGESVVLSWPAGLGAGYSLFWTEDLSELARWAAVTNTVSTNGVQCEAAIPPERSPRYFRLSR